MSGTLTTGFRQRILRHVVLSEALGFDHVDVALTGRVPSANAAVSQLNEPVGMAYARVRIPLGGVDWLMTLSGEAANSTPVYFPTATGNWGVMAGWALISVEASPIVCAVGQLVTPYRVLTGKRLYIPATGLAIGLDD